jgi:hypothetical protein
MVTTLLAHIAESMPQKENLTTRGLAFILNALRQRWRTGVRRPSPESDCEGVPCLATVRRARTPER